MGWLRRYRLRTRQMAVPRAALFDRGVNITNMVCEMPGVDDHQVAHPYFVVHIPADPAMGLPGSVLTKPAQDSSLLLVQSEGGGAHPKGLCNTDGAMVFIDTQVARGPSGVTPLDAHRLVMVFPCGSIQLWAWRDTHLLVHVPVCTTPMSRCVDYSDVWDVCVVGANDGTVTLVRLHQAETVLVLPDDAGPRPVISAKLLARSFTTATGSVNVRMFLAVAHQVDNAPIVHSTAACIFAHITCMPL